MSPMLIFWIVVVAVAVVMGALFLIVALKSRKKPAAARPAPFAAPLIQPTGYGSSAAQQLDGLVSRQGEEDQFRARVAAIRNHDEAQSIDAEARRQVMVKLKVDALLASVRPAPAPAAADPKA